ncbi:MAG: phospholipid carrier-dependent glycosyltransferase [Kineosporiaceae bacterium]
MTTSETLASANGGAPGNPAPTERGPGEPVPTRFRSLLARLRPGPRFWGWAVPSLIAAVGGFLRFWHLDQPHELVFDETYYVKEGASYLKAGYELATNGDATPGPDELFTSGITDVFLNSPGFVVHPPVGKWMIAFGEWVFGVDSSWGWRFSVAAAGTLSLLMIGRIGRRLFGSTLLGSTAALLLAVDGEHFVLSRTGLLDLFVMFWALAGFGFLLIDRDRTTARLAARLARDARSGGADDDPEVRSGTDLARTSDAPISGTDPGSGADPSAGTEPRTGTDPAPPPDAPDPLTAPARTGAPRLGIRWWRTAGWISLALAAGVKWSGLFFLVTFAVLSALWDVGRRRRTGHPNWLAVGLLRDGALSWVYLAPLAVAVYIGTWSGWLFSQGG